MCISLKKSVFIKDIIYIQQHEDINSVILY